LKATLHNPRFWWALLVVWALTVCVLSSIPGTQLADTGIPHADKIVHALIFATGGTLLVLALRTGVAWTARRTALVAFFALLTFGILDEVHQLSTPGRSGGDLGDLSADALGALLGVAFALFAHAKIQKRPSPPAPLRASNPDPAA
jgi:VanZ family protein